MIMVAMVMVALMIVVLFMMLIAPFIAVFFPAFIAMFFTMLLAVLVLLMPLMLPGTDVPRLVFLGPHEIHLPVARMILATVQTPGPCVLGRNVQIERFCHNHMRRRLLNDYRPGIDQRRRRPAIEVYATIDTRRNLSLNGH
jgi:hypothetical protein